MSDIAKKLLEIGFTEYEAKAYSAMLEQNMLTATEISKLSKIPQGRIYNVINTLEQKGFCITITGAVKKFKALSPKTAFSELIEEREDEVEKMQNLAGKLEEKFNSIEKTTSPLDFVHVLTSKQSQFEKFSQIAFETENIIRSFSKPPYLFPMTSGGKIKPFKPAVDLIEKGVETLAIWEVEEDNLENFLKYVTYFEEIGEKVRISDNLPIKLFISDNNTVMFTIQLKEGSKNSISTMVVENIDLSLTLIKLFEFYWESSMTLDQFLESRDLKRIEI